MEKSSKRGKIPQSDWPLIMARYDSGETLASIARTYDCSPPAISYVVSRSRARQPGAEQPPPPTASVTPPQLIKAAAGEPVVREPAVNGSAPAQAADPAPVNGQSGERHEEIWPREGNGFARDGAGERHPDPPGIAARVAAPMLRPPVSQISQAPVNGDQRRTLHLSLGNDAAAPAERHNFAGDSQQAQNHLPQHQTTDERFP